MKGPTAPRASELAHTQPSGDLGADVVVVGAGPAGSATAAFLARCGIDVILLEKSRFPRDKVCGDGLTPRAVKMLNRLGLETTEENGWHRNLGLKLFGGKMQPLELPWPLLADYPNYGLVCPRITLDDILAGIAVENGARLLTETNVQGLIFKRSRAAGVITSDGRRIEAPIVVAADGNSAKMAAAMGIYRNEKRPMGVAVRAYFKSPLADEKWLISHLELWDGKPGKSDLLPGYGWIFPAGNGVCNVGLGMLSTSAAFGHTNYRQLMRRWLANAPKEFGFTKENMVTPIGGAALPMAFNRKPHYQAGMLLVGDSGGMVSPLNGEGIDYALEAAEIAAECIVDALSRGVGTRSSELALKRYPAELSDHYGGYFRVGMIFAKLIGNPKIMRLAIKYGLPSRPVMRIVHKLLANLTDKQNGDWTDRLINTLCKLVPSA